MSLYQGLVLLVFILIIGLVIASIVYSPTVVSVVRPSYASQPVYLQQQPGLSINLISSSQQPVQHKKTAPPPPIKTRK
jgi:hypothetical protein